MRPKPPFVRQVNALELVGKQVLVVIRYPVVRHEKTVIVRQADEVAIEEPVARGGERQAILNDVGAAMLDGAYVRSLNFCPASAVHDPQSCDGAGFPVGGNDGSSERPVSQRTVHQQVRNPAILLPLEAPPGILRRNRSASELAWSDR